jgi:hypothetical protein
MKHLYRNSRDVHRSISPSALLQLTEVPISRICPPHIADELGGRSAASEDVKLMLAKLGSARPRLPQVVTKMFDFTSALRAD